MDQQLCNRISDCIRQSDARGSVTHTDFLTQEMLMSIKSMIERTSHLVYGGIATAERNIVLFGSQLKMEQACKKLLYGVHIICTNDAPYTHGQYLGSLMSLGIKREKFGDLIVVDHGAYLIAFDTIARYILDNLTRVSDATVQVALVDICDIPAKCNRLETHTFHVSSLRADNVAAKCFQLSRAEMQLHMERGFFFVNHAPHTKPEKLLKVGDLFSFTGYGRARLTAIETQRTKKGKIKIEIERE